MNAKEFRIGNIVILKYPFYAYPVDPVTIALDSKTLIEIIEGTDAVAEGIPLTEQWLLKLGFIQNNYEIKGCQYDEPFYNPVLEAKGWRIKYSESAGWCIYPHPAHGNVVPLKFVHALQNIYFALTGEELETKTV